MKRNLKIIDEVFLGHYAQLLDIQKTVFNQLKDYDFDLESHEITQAIHDRMSTFWNFNVTNAKEILERKVNAGASDFFTETCMLFFKTYFEQRYDVKVLSEKSIVRGRNSIKPDISIWSGHEENKLLAVVELKVNNGWKGKGIMAHLEERETIIKKHSANLVFFGVISFWTFFDENQSSVYENKYFGLYHFKKDNNHIKTDGYVEDLIKNIELALPKELLKKNKAIAI